MGCHGDRAYPQPPLPPVVMATVYSRIYGIARRQAREIHKLEASLGVFDATPPPPGTAGRFSDPSPVDARRSAAGNSKEPKAIKTLGILMGMLDRTVLCRYAADIYTYYY